MRSPDVRRAPTGRCTASEYSSALGVLNGGVTENAISPESAQRILAGTASRDEQIAMAVNEREEYGIRAWACGRKLYPELAR